MLISISLLWSNAYGITSILQLIILRQVRDRFGLSALIIHTLTPRGETIQVGIIMSNEQFCRNSFSVRYGDLLGTLIEALHIVTHSQSCNWTFLWLHNSAIHTFLFLCLTANQSPSHVVTLLQAHWLCWGIDRKLGLESHCSSRKHTSNLLKSL